jgi:redox-sensitive bicupin YhaK (pirin superfamily)
MLIKRKLITIHTPPAKQGFLGSGHIARAVIGGDFAQSDPFILLMDDMLDKQDGEPAGGPHPHAGFETVTLLLEGEVGDSSHIMKAGDFQVMTAGSGIVHTETIDTKMKMRLLQLWLNLPEKEKWTLPRVQDLSFEHAPLVVSNESKIRVYSGSFAGVTSPVNNYVPLIVADIQLRPNSIARQQIPASFNTFLYVIEGSLKVGEENKVLTEAQIGWLDKFSENTPSEISITAGETGGRVILYAGQPTSEEIVSHGPFIGNSQDDIIRLYQAYRNHQMKHITTVPASQKILF